MAETLLAIALVTSSSNGSSLICRWPPSPQATPRLARPRPHISSDPDHYDNTCRSPNSKDGHPDDDGRPLHAPHPPPAHSPYTSHRPPTPPPRPPPTSHPPS